ncbi:hypothetical protein ACOZ4F_17415 [Haloarcula marismortui]|uniref:hypothetical protein n=1 Tax=Haloarcula marismortui TaxID=2238 RepID=UPI003C77CA00
MRRRQLLSTSALSVALSGCLVGDFGDRTGDATQASNATETATARTSDSATETPPPDVSTPECWPAMCEGSTLVEAQVVGGFSGEVVLRATCQNKEVPVPPGETVRIKRGVDAQVCSVDVVVDGEQAFSGRVSSHQSVRLKVDSNGDVTARWVVQ